MIDDSAGLRTPALADSGGPLLPPLPPGATRPNVRWRRVLLLTVVVSFVLMALACGGLFLFVLPRYFMAKENLERASCTHNLQIIYAALQAYAAENGGLFPPISDEPGRLMFATENVYSEYLVEPRVFLCPAMADAPDRQTSRAVSAINDQSYVYVSHALTNEREGAAYVDRPGRGLPMDVNLEIDPSEGKSERIYRLRQGVERYLAEDPLNPVEVNRLTSRIPVLIEWPGHHGTPGGNVLFLDGHVEYVAYPGEFPMTRAFIKGLQALDDSPSP